MRTARRDATRTTGDIPLASLAGAAAALATRPYVRRGAPATGETIRVVLADDHALLRAGLKALLRSAPDIVVVGEAASGPDAVQLATTLNPDVVVMDRDMPGGGGGAATEALAAQESPVRVLILTMHTEEERLLPLLRSGARGYLAKDAADRELVDAIRVVASGEVYVRPAVARLLARAFAPPRDPVPASDAPERRLESLSEREREVLRLVATGYSGPEAGRLLGITAKTVDTYKQRIEDKLGFAHRTDYVRFALAAGLLHA
jgi:DNA-binding NarL/FixJ family response regulator